MSIAVIKPMAALPRTFTISVPSGNDEAVHNWPTFAMRYRSTPPIEPPRAITRIVEIP